MKAFNRYDNEEKDLLVNKWIGCKSYAYSYKVNTYVLKSIHLNITLPN